MYNFVQMLIYFLSEMPFLTFLSQNILANHYVQLLTSLIVKMSSFNSKKNQNIFTLTL